MAKPASVLRSLAETAQTDPARLFWLCAGLQLLVWTVMPVLTEPNILTDVIEGYAWGHEWPLGTYKHPPLAAWILETFAILTNRAAWAHFLASQIAVLIAFWAVWQTGRRIVGKSEALIGALLLTGIGYYNILIPEFNPNVLQLPFWALIGLSYHRAVKDDRLPDWIALGVWDALGMYTKYSTLLLIIAIAFHMLMRPEGRARLKGKGPWIAKLVCILLLLPHLLWLIHNDFMPFTYVGERLEHPQAFAFLVAPMLLVFWQAAALLPAMLVYGLSFGKPGKISRKHISSFDGSFLNAVTFGPFFLAFVIAFFGGFKIRTMWGTPFWNFAGLWAVFYLRPALSSKTLRRFACGWLVVFTVGAAGFAAVDIGAPYATHKASRINFPGRLLAAQISDAWQARYHTPLRYVIGDTWVAGNVAFYAPDRPHLLIAGDYHISPWVAPEDIAHYGGVVVWCRGECTSQDINDVPSWYWAEFRDRADMQSVLSVPQQTGAPVPPAKIGWAIVPPQNP